MILSESAIVEWCQMGPHAALIDDWLDGSCVAALDVMNVLMYVDDADDRRRRFLEDLRGLGVTIESFGYDDVLESVSPAYGAVSASGGVDLSGIRCALALAKKKSQDVAVVVGGRLVRVRVTGDEITVCDLHKRRHDHGSSEAESAP